MSLTHSEYQAKLLEDKGLDPGAFVHLIPIWWRNPTNKKSLRLTHQGLVAFHKFGLKSYEIKIASPISSKHLLQLERLFKEPYYIRGAGDLVVFGEEDAVMLQLHAGNLAQYLDNLQNNT